MRKTYRSAKFISAEHWEESKMEAEKQNKLHEKWRFQPQPGK